MLLQSCILRCDAGPFTAIFVFRAVRTDLSPVELPTLAVTKSTNKSQTILIYGSPEVERFQIN